MYTEGFHSEKISYSYPQQCYEIREMIIIPAWQMVKLSSPEKGSDLSKAC